MWSSLNAIHASCIYIDTSLVGVWRCKRYSIDTELSSLWIPIFAFCTDMSKRGFEIQHQMYHVIDMTPTMLFEWIIVYTCYLFHSLKSLKSEARNLEQKITHLREAWKRCNKLNYRGLWYFKLMSNFNFFLERGIIFGWLNTTVHMRQNIISSSHFLLQSAQQIPIKLFTISICSVIGYG